MTRNVRLLTIVAALLALVVLPEPAQAQAARTFVSSLGNDANDCSRLTPCRTFQVAHDNTLAAGEITVLDPGGYGAVTITKAISIINDGVGEAGTLVSGGLNGITINAGAADAVGLRGLTVKGIGFGGGNGIVFNSGKSLTVENCVVRNLNGAGLGTGIVLRPNGSSNFAVTNTQVMDNAAAGFLVQPSGSGTVKASFSRIEAYNNGGIAIGINGNSGTLAATVTDSVVANNVEGFFVFSPTSSTSLMVVRSVVANNNAGLTASGGATLRLRQSIVTGNTTSWTSIAGAFVRSYGDNSIDGNADGNPAPTLIPMK